MTLKFKFSKDLGVQLGLGIASSGLPHEDLNLEDYNVKLNASTKASRLKHDTSFSYNTNNSNMSASENNRNISLDLISSDEDDADNLYEHWQDVLLTKLNLSDWNNSLNIETNIFPKHSNYDEDYFYDAISTPGTPTAEYVPNDLRPSTLHNMSNLKIIDPNINEKLIVRYMQTQNNALHGDDPFLIIVYSSGKSNNFINIGVLSSYVESDDAMFDETNMDKFQLDPRFQIQRIDMGHTIKSIKIPEFAQMFNRSSDTIAVLTSSTLNVIKLANISEKDSLIGFKIYEPLSYSEFGNFPFADASFNPWDMQELAVIDTKGNWSIIHLPKTRRHQNKLQIDSKHNGSIFDPEELSNWKRIEWSFKYTRLLLFSRSQVVEIDFTEDWQLNLVQAKTWSRILDYKRINDNTGVILTTKELVIIRYHNQDLTTRREISWKHDIDTTKDNIKLSFSSIEVNNLLLNFLIILANSTNKIVVQTFYIDNKDDIKFISIPTTLKIETGTQYTKREIQNIQALPQIIQSKVSLNIFYRYNLSSNIYHKRFFTSNPTSTMENNSSVNIQTKVWKESQSCNFIKKDNAISLLEDYKGRMNNLVLQHYTMHTNEQDELDAFQEYGYNISDKINQLLTNHTHAKETAENILLNDLTKFPYPIKDLEEFVSLLQQLSTHYTDSELDMFDPTTFLFVLFGRSISSINDLYDVFSHCLDLKSTPSQISLKNLLTSLICSSSSISQPSKIDKLQKTLTTGLDESVNDILDNWGNIDINNEDYPSSSLPMTSSISQPQFLFTQSQIPTVRLSQNHSKSSSKRDRTNINYSSKKSTKSAFKLPSSQVSSSLPDTMTPAFSLQQLSVPVLSQSPAVSSSSKVKKKKKRVGGFG